MAEWKNRIRAFVSVFGACGSGKRGEISVADRAYGGFEDLRGVCVVGIKAIVDMLGCFTRSEETEGDVAGGAGR